MALHPALVNYFVYHVPFLCCSVEDPSDEGEVRFPEEAKTEITCSDNIR